MNWQEDAQYWTETIFEVRDDDNGWILTDASHLSIFCPSDKCSVPPKAGETVHLYGKGLGYEVRGIVVEGRVYRYKTEEQAKVDHEAWCEERRKKAEAKLEATRAERDAKIAALPKLFRDRIERFQRTTPDWRRDHEEYEIFCCEEAVKIVQHVLEQHVSTSIVLDRFREDAELQKAVLGKSLEQHSGNTFGAACNLASLFLNSPENVVKQHGALCPLVGCKDYGCYATYPEVPS